MAEDSFALVHDDADLWSYVLCSLPLPSQRLASSTSRFHRRLAQRKHIEMLTLALDAGMPETAQYKEDCVPYVIIHERTPGGLRMRHPAHIAQGPTVPKWAYLPAICKCYPALTALRIDLTPTPDLYGHSHYGCNHLWDTSQWFACAAIRHKTDPLRGAAGCHPLRLLDLPLVTRLELSACKPTPPRGVEVNDSFGSFDSVEEMRSTSNVLVHLLLLCAVSCAPRLTHLDLTGVGYGMFTQLTMLELPRLRVLRMGEAGMEANLGWRYEAGRLEKLGRAFPTLTALDIGYANFSGGVSFASLQALLQAAPGIEHLDLSQVMTYIDFGPALTILASHAPKLRSLAVHGLSLPPDEMLSMARGCPNLERLHWVAPGRVAAADLLDFLRACPNLKELDMSMGSVDQSALLSWIRERQEADRPVEALVLNRCKIHRADGQAQLLSSPGPDDWSPFEFGGDEATGSRDAKLRGEFKRMALDITSSLSVSVGCNAGVWESDRNPWRYPNVVIDNQVNNEDLQMYRWKLEQEEEAGQHAINDGIYSRTPRERLFARLGLCCGPRDTTPSH